jgi:hypothetical protein
MWSWRFQESLSCKMDRLGLLPPWAHLRVCPFCSAALSDIRRHERDRARHA